MKQNYGLSNGMLIWYVTGHNSCLVRSIKHVRTCHSEAFVLWHAYFHQSSCMVRNTNGWLEEGQRRANDRNCPVIASKKNHKESGGIEDLLRCSFLFPIFVLCISECGFSNSWFYHYRLDWVSSKKKKVQSTVDCALVFACVFILGLFADNFWATRTFSTRENWALL